MKVFKYMLIYLLIIQIGLPYVLPLDVVYNYRMNYEVVKDNTSNIDLIIDRLSQAIKASKEDYVIILGDSVAFSGPGPATQSIGYYLAEWGRKEQGLSAPRIYNLSMPAMQTGDIYTMLLKLEEQGIAANKLIFNVIYAGFAERSPDPPPVFWLKAELKRLDPDSYNDIYPALIANGYKEEEPVIAAIKKVLWDNIALLKYNDVLRLTVVKYIPVLKERVDALGDARPWYEKEGLKELLEEPEYQKGFNDKPVVMDQANPQIYFLDKIMAHQKGKKTLVFIGGANTELMAEEVNKPGYQSNLTAIDNYFNSQEIRYINFQDKIDNRYFTDHVHLTAEGYRRMAEILYPMTNLP